MPAARKKIHEVDFCAQMAGAVNEIVGRNPAVYPFREARGIFSRGLLAFSLFPCRVSICL